MDVPPTIKRRLRQLLTQAAGLPFIFSKGGKCDGEHAEIERDRRERERERETTWSTSSFTSYHGQLLSLAVQWGVAIEIERAIKKSASFC